LVIIFLIIDNSNIIHVLRSKFSDIRNNYARHSLYREDLDSFPLLQLKRWLDDAVETDHAEPTAMTVATVDVTGQPSLRVVLLKGISEQGIVFFTNYQSLKGRQIDVNPKVSAGFFWAMLERQVRIEGIAKKLAIQDSDAYFASRPRGSRLGAWASPQSEVIPDKEYLLRRYQEFEEKFLGKDVPRPAHWGGYMLVPHRVEFWQGRPNRMHDRFLYRRDLHKGWVIDRLAP
jgi:pyridoxamine 5'-phosphate oxidase